MDGDVGGEYQRGGLELANRCEWNKCLRVRTAAAQSEGCSHHRAPPEALVFRRAPPAIIHVPSYPAPAGRQRQPPSAPSRRGLGAKWSRTPKRT